MFRFRAMLAAAGLGLIVSAAYWSAWAAGFVSDDFLILRRLADRGGLQGAASYFDVRHFEYYRPLAFLSFAADWEIWGRLAAGYHATSVVLHVLNTVLVFVLGRRLMGFWPAAAGAALFGLHPSSHEAVYWVSARFDLLATAGCLAGLIALRGTRLHHDLISAAAFLVAVLSKESALTFPLVAAAYALTVQQAGPLRILRQFLLFGGAGAAYLWLRHGSGLAAAGGSTRVPKLIVVAAMAAITLYAARAGWPRLRQSLSESRVQFASLVALATAALGLLAASDLVSAPFRRALVSLAFGAMHLTSPVALDWLVGTLPPSLWVVGWLVIPAAGALVLAAWRPLTAGPALAFTLVFLAAALVPVSSMTEGTRYLYLASVAVSLLAGLVLERIPTRHARLAGVVTLALLAAGGWSVRAKGHDWVWAGTMTADAASVISSAIGPRCEERAVILATAPVRVRGVYANLTAESLAWLRQCEPDSLRTVVRAGYDDPVVTAAWESPEVLTLGVESYRGGFVTSRDLRTFDIDIGSSASTLVSNRIGSFYAKPADGGLVIRQVIDRDLGAGRAAWFVFSQGRLRPIPPPG